jgi:hypothetical protein
LLLEELSVGFVDGQHTIGAAGPAPLDPFQQVPTRSTESGELPGEHEDVTAVVDRPAAVSTAHPGEGRKRARPHAVPDVGWLDQVVGDSIGSAIGPAQCETWKDLVVAFGSAWLACKEGKVVRIEIPSGKPTTITTGAGAHTFAVTNGAVWVTNYQADSVSRIDPTSGRVTLTNGAGSGVGITSGGGYVWAAAGNGIAKIDPETSSIVDMIDLGPGQCYELVWDDGIIWVSTRGSRVLKVDAP